MINQNLTDSLNDSYTFYGPVDIFYKDGHLEDSVTVKVIVTIILCFFMVTSIIGNICTCAVIARDKTMRTPTNCYLLNLAVTDLLMAFFIPYEIYLLWVPDIYPFGEIGCRIHYVLWDCLSGGSSLTISAFTVERYLVVSRPFLRQRLTLKTRVYKVISIVWVISFLVCIPDMFAINLVERNTYIYCSYTASDMVKLFLTIDIILFFFIPMTIITVLYVMIALKLKENLRKMQHSPVYGKRDRDKAVKMLAAVAGLFFFCWAPYCAFRIMVITPKFKYDDKVWRVVYFIVGVNVYLSTTGNPILYSLMSRKFRTAFKDLLKGKNSSRRGRNLDNTITSLNTNASTNR